MDRAGPGVVRGCRGSSGPDRMGPGACWVNSTGREGSRDGEKERGSRKGGRESRRQEKEGEEEEEKEIRDGEGEEGGREIRT